jgi:hypothetical protein
MRLLGGLALVVDLAFSLLVAVEDEQGSYRDVSKEDE